MSQLNTTRRVLAMGDRQRYLAGDQLDELVAAALDGEQDAWTALVARLERVVWKAVNMMTHDSEVRNDAFAATWLRLAERLGSIREPEKLPGWLTTTATNEVRQIVRRRSRDDRPLTADHPGRDPSPSVLDTLVGDDGEHAVGLVAAEQRRNVRRAFAALDDACREIITVLVLADPPVPYDEASERLGRPVGSLGPTRGRCLDKMRHLLAREPDLGADR